MATPEPKAEPPAEPTLCAVERPHEPAHFLVYGDAGSQKSTFAATFPKPILVFAFDPRGKEAPYLRAGRCAAPFIGAGGTPTRQVWHADRDEVVIQLEHYIDTNPEAPEAYLRFLKRISAFSAEHERWATVAIDSVTFMDLAARYYSQHGINRTNKDGRAHYGYAKEALEAVLQVRVGALPMNVVVIAHVDEDKDEVHGGMLYNPAAPGKLSKRLPAGYAELYHAAARRTDKGAIEYWMQTQSDGRFNCATQIPAPNPARPDYNLLWGGR